MPPLVSVVIPTHHRPEMLGAAVRSVLAQRLDGGDLEVIVAVSDAGSEADLAAARGLAREDPRVAVAVADRTGPAAARNAGLAAARAERIAFLDDDCEARPGWLAAGVARLDQADLVQGRTVPSDPTARVPWAYTIAVDELSWLWETCNLFVRRAAADRAGGFDEGWNPRRRPGTHWGEDTEWGWRVVSGGASYAFEPGAVVAHAVFARTYAQWLEYKLRVRFMPLFVREMPGVRRHFVMRYFADAAHLRAAGAVALAGAAGVARLAGRRRASAGLLLAAAVPFLEPARTDLLRSAEDTAAVAAALWGSARHRRLVL